jgi:hypothetical protein
MATDAPHEGQCGHDARLWSTHKPTHKKVANASLQCPPNQNSSRPVKDRQVCGNLGAGEVFDFPHLSYVLCRFLKDGTEPCRAIQRTQRKPRETNQLLDLLPPAEVHELKRLELVLCV